MQLINPEWYKDDELRADQYNRWVKEGTSGIMRDMAYILNVFSLDWAQRNDEHRRDFHRLMRYVGIYLDECNNPSNMLSTIVSFRRQILQAPSK
jgi:hypothetical protein